MRGKQWFTRIVATALGTVVAAQLWAFPEVARQTKSACASCHVNPAGGADLTDGGKAWKAESKAPAAAAKAADYVGSTKCKMCHIKQHKAWAETPHAKAFINLQKAEQAAAEAMAEKIKVKLTAKPATMDECVKCHVTGFKLAGGYPAADSAKTAVVAMVGCEACHGPGSLHASAPMAEKKKMINKAGTGMCKQCHTPEMSPKFDAAEWAKKVHPVKTEG